MEKEEKKKKVRNKLNEKLLFCTLFNGITVLVLITGKAV